MNERRRRRAWLGLAAAVVAVAVLYWLLRDDRSFFGTRTAERPDGAAESTASAPGGTPANRTARPALVAADVRLAGRVIDLEGAPVAGAEVRVASVATSATAVSGSDGAFAFDDLPAGEYFVDAATATAACPSRRIALRPRTPPIVLRLSPAIRTEVTVLDRATERPVVGAVVEVQDRFGETPFRSAVTDERGKAALAGLPPDGYAVMVSAPGYRSKLEPFPARAGLEWSVTVLLSAGVAVRGRVVDDRGSPVEAATIGPLPAAGAIFVATPKLGSHSVLSDANGEFSITLDAGQFRLVATHPRHVHGTSDVVSVDGSSPVSGVRIVVERGASIAGRAVLPDGSPASFAMVRSSASRRSDIGKGLRETSADADGRFLIEGLPPVPMELVAMTSNASSAAVAVDLEADPSVDELVIELVHDGVIAGVVSGRDGRPVEDAQVFCVGGHAEAVGTRPIFAETTDASGRFACRALVPGVYSITITRPYPNNNQGPQARSTTLRSVETGATDVKAVLPDDGALVGRVRALGGAPLASFGVAVDAGGGPRQFDGSDGGRFALDGLAPKKYQVRVTADGYIPRVLPDVVVPEGGKVDVGDVELARAMQPPR